MDFFQFFSSALLIYFGADLIIKHGKELALSFGIPEYIIGLTLISFGTSFPELVVNLNASLINESSIAIGNIIGSNIANITLVLPCAVLILPLTVKKINFDILSFFLLSAAFLYIFCLDGYVTRLEGFLFMSAFILFCIRIKGDTYKKTSIAQKQAKFDYLSLIILFLSFIVLIIGSNLFIESAISVADKLGVSKVVISLTMVALGTSLPELATSVVAAIKREHGLLIGNIIGSNIMNILLVLAASALVNEIDVMVDYLALTLMFSSTILIYIYSIYKITLSKIVGFTLLLIYFIFNYSLFINNKI